MTSMKAADITQAVGAQVMDALNEAGPVATMGTPLPDGTYEFLLGPVYLPRDQVGLTAITETRQLLVNLRFEDADRAPPRPVIWMVKRGDEYAEHPQPAEAIVVDKAEAPPDENVLYIYYHLSA